MSPIVLLLLFSLLPNILSQIIPLRFDLAINHLRQQEHQISPDLSDYVDYNLTPEEMFLSLSSNTTNACEHDFEMILQAALKRETWAMKVFDSWGKPLPSGVLSGNVYWVGSYDECLQQMYLPANKSFVSQPFDTQYCTLLPPPSKPNSKAPLGIILGLCVPSSCDRESVASLIHTLFKKDNVTKNDLVCSSDPPNGQKGLTPGAIATCVVLSLLGFIVFIGTIADLILTSQQHSAAKMTSNINGYNYFSDTGMDETESIKLFQKSRQPLIDSTSCIAVFAEFSAIRTLRRIFTMKEKNDENSFTFINGIRVLALFWVIIGHSIAFGLAYTNNIVDVLVWTRNVSFQLVLNAVLSVDTSIHKCCFFIFDYCFFLLLVVLHRQRTDDIHFLS